MLPWHNKINNIRNKAKHNTLFYSRVFPLESWLLDGMSFAHAKKGVAKSSNWMILRHPLSFFHTQQMLENGVNL